MSRNWALLTLLIFLQCSGTKENTAIEGVYKVIDHTSYPISALDEKDIRKILGATIIIRKHFVVYNGDTCRNVSIKRGMVKTNDALYEVKSAVEKRLSRHLPEKLLTNTIVCNGLTWDAPLWYFVIYDRQHIIGLRDGEVFFLDRTQ